MKKVIALLLASGFSFMLYAQKGNPSINSLQKQLPGTWTLISVVNIYPDSSREYPYGKDPQGLLMFDEKGNYAIQILKAVRPKIESGDKNKCTPEESTALVQGSNSHFGKYRVNEEKKTITFMIEHAFYPNWEGIDQERFYTYTGSEIKYVVTHTTQGGRKVIAEVAWQKVQ
ncbi:hypothetical protein A4H97_12720 [Niastella yeongjuensis]|uniref:Lipocalin-like domain-containing protein n=1 Tax=Niastella yeongjuensis TaxID=354355 RepID=A0A1V9EAJ1_9BACT|nr:lipocalin-like domain-containing protein [Niastella yeongjuensis]OQP43004.1 hypothetical protein A4H97_12720 [Niastella yeongjuensis]SEO62889.1 Lipocalin-like domain-containing protein [Niastella yeongjuensis]